MEDWQIPDTHFPLKLNLNSLILLPLTAFVTPSLGSTFIVQVINAMSGHFLFYVLLSSCYKKQTRKARRKKTRKSCALHCEFTYTVLAGRGQNIMGLIDRQELVPDVDHKRCIIKIPFEISP